MACLLTFTGGYAWKIVNLVKEGDDGIGATFTATYISSAVEVNVTNIDANGIVTLNISLNGDDYYLKKLEYEYVMDLGGAESRWNRAPGFATRETIAINTDYAHSYAGDYIFTMPASDVIIYATFAARTDISSFSLTLDGTAASTVYDGYAHVLTLKNGDTPLTKDVDYTISPNTYSWTDVFSATPTVTGIGKYKGTINSTTLSITQKNLTITAKAQTISYGSSIQTGVSQVNITGLVTNDGLTGITLTPSTSDVTNTGTITPSAATTTKGISNYNVTYNTGLLTITQKDLSGIATVTFTKDYHNYDGSPHQPSIDNTDGSNMKIYYGETRLTQGSDFTTSYTATNGIYTNGTDYTRPDIYTIDITFIGNYTGTKRINYQIRPQITRTGSAWTTFYYNQYEMRVPSGLEAYTVGSIASTQVGTVSQNFLLRGVPMLIYRTGDTQSFYPELVSPGSATINGNRDLAFIGTYSNLDMAAATSGDPSNDYWILKSNQFVRTKSGSLDSNKCYLKLPKTQFSSPSLSLSRGLDLDDETTNVISIENGELRIENDKYYDLSGRRVLYPTKGIYIVNGKKIVIK